MDASGETPESLRDLSVSLDNVGNTVQAMGKYEDAKKRFEESLEISRKLIERVGETPESLRDLSVSLNNVGNTVQALGQLATARERFEEGLAIVTQLSETFSEHVDYAELADIFRKRLKVLMEEQKAFEKKN